jgi:hypothetical protein
MTSQKVVVCSAMAVLVADYQNVHSDGGEKDRKAAADRGPRLRPKMTIEHAGRCCGLHSSGG